MVHLNLFSKQNILLPLGSRIFLCVALLSSNTLYAEIIPFFNPLNTVPNKAAKFEMQGFIANDPVSLKNFFDDWGGKYSPQNGDNIATEMSRVDMGATLWGDIYVGYFYQRDALLRANRGLVDGFHIIKNDIQVNRVNNYDLSLEIEGVERHGFLLSKSMTLIDTDSHRIKVGISGYLSYESDVQSGTLSGKGSIYPDTTYSAAATANYHFMDNLLYDGWNVEETYGIGYGFHLGINYDNKEYAFSIHLLANDLFARSHWQNLPYSIVNIETNNDIIGDDGYTEYDPTISGWEIYKDFVQKIKGKYHVDMVKRLDDNYEVELGLDSFDYLHMPYISLAKQFDEKKVKVLYEHRFHIVGASYEEDDFYISIQSNGFKNASAVGISGSYVYHF